MSQAVVTLPANPFGSIERLANREIARHIVAAMRDGASPSRWQYGERLIARALDDAQLASAVEQRHTTRA